MLENSAKSKKAKTENGFSVEKKIEGRFASTFLKHLGRSLAAGSGASEAQRIRLVLAVSGGVDSMVLLRVATQFQETLDLFVAHVDHGLRPESGEEASLVGRYAGELGLSAEVFNAPKYDENMNLELWARQVRYSFLEEYRSSIGADIVATAHHVNDQAETVLMRMFDGRMLTDSHSIASYCEERKIIRPFLKVYRSEIEEYAIAKQVPFTEDSSNTDCRRGRNFLRHKVIPLVQSGYNSAIVSNVSAVAGRFGNDEAYLWEEAKSRFSSLVALPSRGWLLSLPLALRWRVLKLLVVSVVGVDGHKVGFAALERAARLDFQKHRRVELGFGLAVLFNARDELEVYGDCSPREEVWQTGVDFFDEKEPLSKALIVPGEVSLEMPDGAQVTLRSRSIVSCAKNIGKSFYNTPEGGEAERQDFPDSAIEVFDWDVLRNRPLRVRFRRDGDSVSVYNRGRRKLKKLFQEQGLTLTERNTLPIVECGNEILWVPGVARSKTAALSDETRRLMVLEYCRTQP